MIDKWIPMDNHTFKVGDRVKLRNGEEDKIMQLLGMLKNIVGW